MSPILVGIAGKLRSGKSTLANKLAYNNNMQVLSFATLVRKEVAKAFFPQHADPLAQWMALESSNKAAVRPILQAWGHGKRVLLMGDYWVNELDKQARKQKCEVVFIDDVRYPNEVEYIVNNGGYIIRLRCDEKLLIERGTSKDALKHPSENALNMDILTLAESMLPFHTMSTDSGLLGPTELQNLTTHWLLQNNVPLRSTIDA